MYKRDNNVCLLILIVKVLLVAFVTVMADASYPFNIEESGVIF